MAEPEKPQTQPATITTARLEEITGLGIRRIQQLVDAGTLPRGKRGTHPTEETLAAFIGYLKERQKAAAKDLKEEQRLLTKARRETTEHDLAVSRREFIPRAEVGPWLRNVGLHQRALLLRKYEQELTPKLVGKSTIEILELVRQVNDEVIKAYREGVHEWLDEPPK